MYSVFQNIQENRITSLLVAIFSTVLLIILIRHPRMFFKRHGRNHAFLGLSYLLWLSVGLLDVFMGYKLCEAWLYDVILGILGIVLTLTAAQDFQHKGVKNVASGTLDEHATVTHGEMIEHSFYQGLNLCQTIFLHLIGLGGLNTEIRLLLMVAATSPWCLRDLFPVNKFSDNYVKEDERSSAFVRVLYRIKKYQYIFYKHFLLHGLNVSAALYGPADLARLVYFRRYWLLLNTSYVMEFFLQTLVKKRRLSQSAMLWMQKVLMVASTIAALRVLQHVSVPVAVASLVLNFVHRKHDLFNTIGICVICYYFQWAMSAP